MPSDRDAVSGLGSLVASYLAGLHALPIREVIATDWSRPVAMAAYLQTHRSALASWSAALDERGRGAQWHLDPAGFAVTKWRLWLSVRNQFLLVTPSALDALSQLHRASLCALRETLLAAHDAAALRVVVEAVGRTYQQQLVAWLVQYLGSTPVESICAEYSAETQLRVLGLDIGALRAPVLDVGCGSEARLVALMRDHGVDAVGIDRHADAAHALAIDWTDYRFAPASWGTVVSHLGLSLHFLHRHLGPSAELALEYARKYMEILNSLQVGGSFVYAPSLPFIEDVLPSHQYRVRRIAVDAPALAERPDLASSSWVTRIY
jgi:hypothetical protein